MGQRKRVQLAFALACNTPVLLLDEPTNGLDIPSKRVLRKLLAGYADERRDGGRLDAPGARHRGDDRQRRDPRPAGAWC